MAKIATPVGMLSGLTPHITIRDGRAEEAIAFYHRAFDARELTRTLADDGHRLLYALLSINRCNLTLNDEFPEYQATGHPAGEPISGIMLHLEVQDAQLWWDRALDAGADVRFPLGHAAWGRRYGQLCDPFGYCWSIGSEWETHH